MSRTISPTMVCLLFAWGTLAAPLRAEEDRVRFDTQVMAVLSKAAGERLQGAVQGYAQSAGAVASIAGLVAGGVFYVVIGPVLFLVAGATVGLAGLFAASYRPGPGAAGQAATEPSVN